MEGNNSYPRDDLCFPPAVANNLHYVVRPDSRFHRDAKSVTKSLAAANLLLNTAPDSVVFAQTLHSQ